MIRAVLDTNVFVSAFLIPGKLNRLVDLLLEEKFRWLISLEILEEYAAVAYRPLFHLSTAEGERLFYQLKERTEWISVRSHFTIIARDPSDDKFPDCAVDGRADWIVTGDRDLLALKEFQGVRIDTPSAFLRLLTS